MNDHPARAENVPRPRGAEPHRYAITLAALLATAQVPVADQVEEQPRHPLMTTPVVSTPPGTRATARATPVVTDPNEKGVSQTRGVEVREAVAVPRGGRLVR
jgi:hypothetical protein